MKKKSEKGHFGGGGGIFDILFIHVQYHEDWVSHTFIICYDSSSRDTACCIPPSFLGGRMLLRRWQFFIKIVLIFFFQFLVICLCHLLVPELVIKG